MKYVAWYTKDSVYQDIFQSHLEPTLKEYNLDYTVYPMPNYNKWNYNVCQKPSVVLKAIKELKEPFVLLDVDCKITAEPVLFDRIDKDKFDIACHYLDWATWYNRPEETRKELLTGTMWFNYNQDVVDLCNAWHKVCINNKCADQIPIENLLKAKFNNIRVCKLPLEYCFINSLPNGQAPFVNVKKPVITHYQASRTAKKGVL